MQKNIRQGSITPRETWSIKLYFSEISSYPILSREEEHRLAVSASAGDEAAFQKLISPNLKFVVHVAKEFVGGKLSFEDLVAEGNRGLIAAVRRFNPDLGTRLISYAEPWIRQYILKAIAEENCIIRLPANQLAERSAVRRAEPILLQLLGRKPTYIEIADQINLSPDHVRLCFDYDLDICYLEDKVREGSDFTFLETIEDPMFMAPDRILKKQDFLRLMFSSLNKLPRQRGEILILFFGLGRISPMTIQEIAKYLNLSVQTVQNGKIAALNSLRNRPEMAQLLIYL